MKVDEIQQKDYKIILKMFSKLKENLRNELTNYKILEEKDHFNKKYRY